MSNNGSIQISDGSTSKTFQYIEWSPTTPASLTFLGVTFTLWLSETTAAGIERYGPAIGHGQGGYNIKFADGITATMATQGIGSNPPAELKYLTTHINPQAGIFINTTTGVVYFLVSQ